MGEPELLGESAVGPGYLLLAQLSLTGWQVSVTGRDDGEEGVTVRASKVGRLGERNRLVERSGVSVAEVAVDVVTEAVGELPAMVEPWWTR